MDDFHFTTKIGPNGELHVNVPLPPGQEVNVTVETRDHTKGRIFNTSLAGTPVEYIDPFEPAVPPEDWEAISGNPS
jgi:hypothetical protein